MYLSYIDKCICLILTNVFLYSLMDLHLHHGSGNPLAVFLPQRRALRNVFVSNCKMYLSYIDKCISLLFTGFAPPIMAREIPWRYFSPCVAHFEMLLSQIAKCICLKLKIVLVSTSKMYLSTIAKCICHKFQNVFVSIFTI